MSIMSGEQALAVLAAWRASARLRTDFGESFELYSAYIRAVAAGRLRVSGGRSLPPELRAVFPNVQ